MVMMICAGKLGCPVFVFGRGMSAGDHAGGMQGTRARDAVICRSDAVTLQRGAARAGRRAATAQSSSRTRTTSTHMSAPAGSATAAASARVAAAAAGGAARRAS